MLKVVLFFTLVSQFAMANCPDLTGTYVRTVNNITAYMKIETKLVNGSTVYHFETGVTEPTWTWTSIADGKTYPKEIKNHENVTEVAVCKNNSLYRVLTGDFPNGGEMYPFELKADLKAPSVDTLHLHGEFKGYGIEDVYDHYYQRK